MSPVRLPTDSPTKNVDRITYHLAIPMVIKENMYFNDKYSKPITLICFPLCDSIYNAKITNDGLKDF